MLLLMALSAVLVLPALTPLGADAEQDPRAAVIASARRAAIRRGEALRLRIDADGVWALVTQRDGNVIDSGRLAVGARKRIATSAARGLSPSGTETEAAIQRLTDARGDGASEPVVLTLTALGSCLPSANVVSGSSLSAAPSSDPTSGSAARFDVLACAWQLAAPIEMVGASRSAR